GWRPAVEGESAGALRGGAVGWGRGHRGVDFAAAPGTPVRAAADGVVAFAGSVAGSLHVVVAHDGGLRTTYAFLAVIAVHEGDRVSRGQVVGAAGGSGPERDQGGLHFGGRLGDRYVDPPQ